MLRIGYKPAFLRQLKKLPAALQEEAKEHIEQFSKDPEKATLRMHKLKGALRGRWSFSVNYRYRIVFAYENKHAAMLLMIGDHSIYE